MAKIIGNTTATPNPRPDWNQTDTTKADYIKNKPVVLTEEQVKGLIDEFGGDTQVQADFNQTDETKSDYIKNKPNIPTKTSELANDSNFVTLSDVPDEIYVGNGDMPEGATIQILTDGSDAETELKNELKEYIDNNFGALTLDKHTDGLIYLFRNGLPVGNGVTITGEVIEGDVFGYVDENNNIVLIGNLADGTYSVKYEMEDGSTVDIGDLVLNEDEPTYTNFADQTSADWKEGYRLTNTVDEITALTGGVVTNYIRNVQRGDVIEVSGINIADSNSRTAYWFNSTDNNILKSASFSVSTALSDVTYDANSLKCTITSDPVTDARIRFSGLATGTSADVVIKIKRNGEYL